MICGQGASDEDRAASVQWLREALDRIREQIVAFSPPLWKPGCLTGGVFTPPDDIPTSTPPPIDWPWIGALWEAFPGGSGNPPNSGPPSWSDPHSKHVDRSHPQAADDPAGGTMQAPFATVQFGLDQLSPGAALYVHKPADPNPAKVGLYEESLLVDKRPGSAAQPFWVFAVPGVRIGNLASKEPGLRIRNSRYWVFQDFEFDGGGSNARRDPATGKVDLVTGIDIDHSTACVVHDCHVHGFTRAGISLVESDSCMVSTCRVVDNERGDNEDCHGMQVLWGCRDTLAWNNTTRGNGGDGIHLQQGHEDSLLPGSLPQPPPGAAPWNTTIVGNGVDLKKLFAGYRAAQRLRGVSG